MTDSISTQVLVDAGTAADDAIPLLPLRPDEFEGWLSTASEARQAWVRGQGFTARPGTHLRLPATATEPELHLSGKDTSDSLSTLGALPMSLPEATYRIEDPVSDLALLGWAMGSYQFTSYKAPKRQPALLAVPDGDQRERVCAIADAAALARDLINIPAGDLLPTQLAAIAEQLANRWEASFACTTGDELLTAGYRTIHAVGRAATDAPRLIDLRWGNPAHPKITLVGKGVCFDSGGLNIKPGNSMRSMKKDMGGAAQALGLAQLIMARALPVRLRVLVPAVENAIAGNAYRPGDIIETYQGTTVEIDNTDAEGRLVMCDALTLACEESPALLVDFSTLTGSARSAVGAEISAMFANDDAVAAAISRHGEAQDDAVWRMPLHQAYSYLLDSKVADTLNSAPSPYAGAVTAALFLEKFVQNTAWVHFDLMAFNIRNRPGRPEGGEAMALRAVFAYLDERFG